MSDSILFIGGGQMAGALIGGLIAAGHPPARLRVAEPEAARADVLRREHGVQVASDASALCAGARLIVLAVKPQVMSAVLRTLKPEAGTTVLSIAAGVRLSTIANALGAGIHVVRSMPNTPAQLRAGISALYAEASVPAAARAHAEQVLAAVGKTVWVPNEALLDAVTALSGSGPAYFFLLTELLRDAGTALGLDAETAAQLARQTFIGAARMAEQSPLDVAQLRANVTSKGGTTEAALKSFEADGLRTLVHKALTAAERRGRELGATLEKA